MKKYDALDCAVLEAKQLTPDVFSLTVAAGELAKSARPGQFAQ